MERLFWIILWALNAITSILIRESGRFSTDTGEGHVKMEHRDLKMTVLKTGVM